LGLDGVEFEFADLSDEGNPLLEKFIEVFFVFLTGHLEKDELLTKAVLGLAELLGFDGRLEVFVRANAKLLDFGGEFAVQSLVFYT
jgi:hypothetical protein